MYLEIYLTRILKAINHLKVLSPYFFFLIEIENTASLMYTAEHSLGGSLIAFLFFSLS